MDVNTTQLDSSTIQELIQTIMTQDDAGEGCSWAEGPDEKAESDSEQEDMSSNDGDNGVSDPFEEHNSGAEGPDCWIQFFCHDGVGFQTFTVHTQNTSQLH